MKMKKYTLLAAVILIATSAGVATAYWGDMGRMGKTDKPNFENREEIIEYKKASMVEHIDQLVADGEITQEQADEKIEWLEERFENGFSHGGKGIRKHFKGHKK